jgi:hypothetical protein
MPVTREELEAAIMARAEEMEKLGRNGRKFLHI